MLTDLLYLKIFVISWVERRHTFVSLSYFRLDIDIDMDIDIDSHTLKDRAKQQRAKMRLMANRQRTSLYIHMCANIICVYFYVT